MDQRFQPNSPTIANVNSPAGIAECLQELASATEIALDIEFDRDRFSYGSTLCLIQLSDGKSAFLIDPFGLNDEQLKPFFLFLEDSRILKIMHAPGEDLQLLNMHGCNPKNIFDTERCARLLNFQSFSLSALMQEFRGVPLDKSQQKTDWTKRPLSNSQLTYAAQDVIFLPEIKEKMLLLAEAKGILDWVSEENKAWDTYKIEEKPAGQFASKDDSKRLPPFQLFVYNALLSVRDQHARRMNKPGYQVIPKEILMDLAFKPELAEQWFTFKGIHPKIQTEAVQTELKSALSESSAEATDQKLLRYTEASRFTQQQRMQMADERKRMSDLTDVYFRPVLAVITERYGEFASAYLLNEKTMTELVSGKTKISGLPYAYRAELILSIAAELEIKLERFA